jgi:hypothetical protein
VTEPQGPDAHLGLDRISDLEEGLLTPAEEHAAREHIAGCPTCQEDVAALAAVRAALLADAEIPMPDDIADRLYSALAALPPLAPSAAAVTTLPAQRGPSRWDRARKPLLGVLAAAAVIALLVVGVIHLPRSSSSSASSAAGTSTAPPVTILHSGRDYTKAGLGPDGAALAATPAAGVTSAAAAAAATSAAAAPAATSAAAAATSAAAAAATSGAAAASAAASSAAAPIATAAAGTTKAGSAAGGATGSSAAAATSAAAPTTTVPVPAATTDALAALRAPGAAQSCIATLLPGYAAPLLIDFAQFEGKPAVIGVLNDPTDPGKLAVIAVGPPACSLYELSYVDKP